MGTSGAGGERYRLAKVLGVLAILASAVSQEYGSGINFVLVNSLGAYPQVTWLVPLAMLTAGLVLIPKVALFARFSAVIPRAGSTYVWLTRSLNRPLGFVVAFLWMVGVVAGIGFLAFSFGSFVATTVEALGLPGHWAVTPAGHLATGLALIWLIFWLHYSGIRNYGRFVTLILIVVLVAAAISIGYGFATPPERFLAAVGHVLGSRPAPPADQTPSLHAFIAVVTVFMFAYGGLTAAASLGGEARDASRTMPRGIFYGWAVALVLFTLVAFALFHAIPWWAVPPLVHSKHSELATTPGLIGLVAPPFVNALVNLLVAIIVGKTVAPQMMDCSRYLFAWAQDGLLPSAFLHTAPSKAPDVALLATAGLGSLFLLEATFGGWSIGVVLRSASLVLVFGMLGVGVLHMRWSPVYRGVGWAEAVARDGLTVVMAVLAIVIAAVLLSSVAVVPHTPLALQPAFQGAVAVVIALLLYARARSARRVAGRLELPAE